MSTSSEAFEYAIKKDVRNNPIVREVDERRLREQWRSVAIGVLFVAVLLFSGWQRVELLQHGYRVEQMQKERGDAGRDQPAPAAGDRDAEVAAAHRIARDRTAASRGARRQAPRSSSSASCRRIRRRRRSWQRRWRNQVSEPTSDNWRATIRSRLLVGAAIFVLWAVGIQARLRLSAGAQARTIFRRARRTSPRGRWTFPPSAATFSTATAACSPTASTAIRSTACRVKSRTPRRRRRCCARALADCARERAGRACRAPAAEARVRLRAPARDAAAGDAASPSSASRASGSSRKTAASIRRSSLPRSCWDLSASTTKGSPASKRPTTARSAARSASCSIRPTRAAAPSAGSSGRRPPARPSS